MKVMVTGGAGYIGCRLVPALLEAGADVRVVDKLVFGDEGLRNCCGHVELERIDIRAVERQHVHGIDTIIHLAGLLIPILLAESSTRTQTNQ